MSRPVRRPCCWAGCGATGPGRYCERHAALAAGRVGRDRRRREGPRVYDTRRWRKLSRWIVSQRPVCEACGDELSTQVDHIESVEARPDRVFDQSNLQALCDRCHGRKTRREDAARAST